MSNESILVNSNAASTVQDAPALVKKIDKTTFVVHVHFSTTSKESMEDKIKRMLKNEVNQA